MMQCPSDRGAPGKVGPIMQSKHKHCPDPKLNIFHA
jgi:hypothetical protein